ncbi:HET-domain-containing protein [Hypoxylon rubiginosum]|uniref:HET-domain-containing protein n=1 Tax=Hypoxylon rubiginosum TaxID=110542 RepID=A0ACB9YTE4_9PEZI|nr:HET-domain-containing protein [Hypoxylon rubiginosum]
MSKLTESGQIIDYGLAHDKLLNGTSGFKYDAIDAATQARLLRVTPGSMDFSLETFNLSDLPSTRYCALSYIWGSAEYTENIYEINVGGQCFYVRRNLYEFLTTSARNRVGGLLFIDAICINQLDSAERRAQVKEMARVYRNANLVVAWLGTPKTREQDDSLESLSQAGIDKHHSEFTAEQWEGFRYLSYHPYWSRVWIVQEVLLARSVTIWCGHHVFPSRLFAGIPSYAIPSPELRFSQSGRPQTVADAVSDSRSPAERIITHRERVVLRPILDPLAQGTAVGTLDEITAELTRPHTAVETYHSRVPDLIHEVIRKFGKLDCTDPRDKLYGFLGIIADSSRAKVIPDYREDTAYAYRQALKIGLEEIRSEYWTPPYSRRLQEVYREYLAYYCNVRDAFRIDDRQSADILKGVVAQIARETHPPHRTVEHDWQEHVSRDNLLGTTQPEREEAEKVSQRPRGIRRWRLWLR